MNVTVTRHPVQALKVVGTSEEHLLDEHPIDWLEELLSDTRQGCYPEYIDRASRLTAYVNERRYLTESDRKQRAARGSGARMNPPTAGLKDHQIAKLVSFVTDRLKHSSHMPKLPGYTREVVSSAILDGLKAQGLRLDHP